MMNRALTGREKALVILVAILVLAAAYYLFVQRTIVDAMNEIEAQRSTLETDIMIAEAKVERLDAMRKELAEIEAEGYKSVVPEYDNLSLEIVFLNSVLTGTTDYTITFSDISTTENIVRRVVNLNFTSASYTDCCNIIEKIQNCKYCTRLGDVVLEPIADYNGVYSSLYGYNYDADYSILHNPLTVSLTATFYEKVPETADSAAE